VSLRIGVDLDGTLADLSSAYHDFERALFGEPSTDAVDPDETTPDPTDREKLKLVKERSRRQEAVWHAIKHTPNFWAGLKPLEPGAVAALYAATIEHRWEVFFVTQRPRTVGDSVQKQSQDWLMAQGFHAPSVLTLSGSRGKAAHALDLDFLIDDLPKNCIDVISDSKCRPILVLRDADAKAESAAKRMNIEVVRSVSDAIGLLAQPVLEPRSTAVGRILKLLGLGR
jgi:phosphoglycolate phosphatase-like HAD superfamily hydrolase